MIAKNVTQEQLERAAKKVGVSLYDLRHVSRGIRFTLKTGEPSVRRMDWRGKMRLAPPYQRLSQRARQSDAVATKGVTFYPVIPGAVCWHGHRDFFRAVYDLAPDAEFRTAMAVYKGREHFESVFPSTYFQDSQRMGYTMPRPYVEACSCEVEEGEGYEEAKAS